MTQPVIRLTRRSRAAAGGVLRRGRIRTRSWRVASPSPASSRRGSSSSSPVRSTTSGLPVGLDALWLLGGVLTVLLDAGRGRARRLHRACGPSWCTDVACRPRTRHLHAGHPGPGRGAVRSGRASRWAEPGLGVLGGVTGYRRGPMSRWSQGCHGRRWSSCCGASSRAFVGAWGWQYAAERGPVPGGCGCFNPCGHPGCGRLGLPRRARRGRRRLGRDGRRGSWALRARPPSCW